MVMDQFVTTYRKDYLWPYVRALGNRPAPTPERGGINQPQGADLVVCECQGLLESSGPSSAQRPLLGPSAYKEEAWSRLGPMGPLLDPKIYPARVGPSPETDTMRFNQPNVFLQKLQEKYPFIYECLRTAPPDDLISRINKDRLSSTYQVDYCNKKEYPDAPYHELLKAAGVQESVPCPEPMRLPGDPCRPNQRSVASRPTSISNSPESGGASRGGAGIPGTRGSPCGNIRGGSFGYGNGGDGEGPGLGGSASLGVTEYQDGISKLGQLIIKENMYSKKPKGRFFH